MSGLRTAAGATTPCDALALAPQVDGAAVGARDGAAAAGVAAGAVAPADDDDDANDAADTPTTTTPRRK